MPQPLPCLTASEPVAGHSSSSLLPLRPRLCTPALAAAPEAQAPTALGLQHSFFFKPTCIYFFFIYLMRVTGSAAAPISLYIAGPTPRPSFSPVPYTHIALFLIPALKFNCSSPNIKGLGLGFSKSL